MSRPPVRWAETELPEGLSRVLESAGPAPADDAALARMRARLRDSIGPSFDDRVPEVSAFSRLTAGLGRGKWLATGAIVAAGFALFSARQARIAEHADRPRAGQSATVPRADQPHPPAALPQALQVEAVQQSAAPAERSSERRSPRVKASRPSVRASGAAQAGLAEELQGIEQLRKLLESSPARALTAAEQQQQRFARGALTPERELLRVEALLRLGRIEEARARAARLRDAPGHHPYREQLDRLLSAQGR